MVKYVYDGWGNHGIEVVDSACETIANLNPFRYRSYYFDTETELYFLKTRYYDPEIGRFMTIDDISYLDPETINGLNLYAYCGNNPVMNVDPNGNAWWHWLVGAVVVAALVAATIFTAGGAGAGLMAIGFAAQGMVMAGASTATTILAFATVGAGVALAASAVVAGIGAIETWSTGGSFSAGLESISDYGATALGTTIGAGIFGGLGGYLSYNQQKITHSWTKERSDYWKNSYNNPNSYGYRQERVLKGLSPIIDGKPVQLHHTMGRVGANFYHYIEMPYLQRIQYHQIYGYKGFSYKTANINIWQILMSLM